MNADDEPHRSRRLSSRVAVRATEAPPESAASSTRNISPGGMCFASLERLEPGRVYALELGLPEAEGEPEGALKLVGRIVWTRDVGDEALYGVEFLKISLSDQRRLYRFLDAS